MYAKETLKHYLKTAFTAAGLPWGPDNDTEVEQIVDSIISAALPSAGSLRMAELANGLRPHMNPVRGSYES